MKEYNNDGRLKVYLAGPFFNEEQEERITFLECPSYFWTGVSISTVKPWSGICHNFIVPSSEDVERRLGIKGLKRTSLTF